MPRRSASDVIHAAITDHRILKRPMSAMPDPGGVLAPWQAPAPAIADRNLGLAWFHLARQNNSGPAFGRAYNLLSNQSHAKDAEASATLGYMLLGSGHSQDSIPLFEAAVNYQPENAEYWLDLGVAQQTIGDRHAAVTAFSRSIALAPYSYRGYKALSDFYKDTHQGELAQQTLAQFLKLVPQSLTIRLLQ
jgi:tetratricopeptide (TPR) repeat protein